MYYEAKSTIHAINEKGVEVKQNLIHLVESLSLYEAVVKEAEEMKPFTGYEQVGVKKSNIARVVRSIEPIGTFHKVKLSIVDADPETGKEKKLSEYYLIESACVEDARTGVDVLMEDCLAPWELVSINPSKICGIIG